MTNIESMKAYIQKQLDKDKSELEAFKGKLDENPSHALEWADNIFKIVARMHIAGYALHYLNFTREGGKQPNEQELVDWMTREFFRRAGRIGGSTSACSNLLEKCMVEAYAEFLDPTFGLSRFSSRSLFKD